MRHRKAGIKLSRTSSHRDAMFRNMVTSLFKYERIKTTDVKAKELRRLADHMITLAKRGDLHAQRQAHATIQEKAVVYKLFNEVAQRFQNINGGYTRLVRLENRAGDAAPMMLIELSALGEKVAVEKKVKKQKSTKVKYEKAKADTAASNQPTVEQPAAKASVEETLPDQATLNREENKE